MRHIGMRYFTGSDKVNVLSIGCGIGAKEIAIALMWPAWTITGIDGSERRITMAREAAARENIANVKFQQGDVGPATLSKNTWQIILFDSSLHHFSGFDTLLGAVAEALTENGMLVINEYVGPDRFTWSREQLAEANRLLRSIPPELRRYGAGGPLKRRIYRPGYLRMVLTDPSEAVNASAILPAIHRRFTTIEEKPLGGNLLHLVLKDIAHHFSGTVPHAQEVLSRLFDAEDRFIDGRPSDFVFGVYKRN
jgi:SAM-dependent methyltransferase